MSTAERLLQGVVSCESRQHLSARLDRGERLRIKFGIDPSSPDIHLGHLVPMRLLRRWQAEGHLPVLVIGDFTARIGDPTGRSVTRPQLTVDEVESNAKTYLDQLFCVIDPDQAEVRRQSEWYDPFDLVAVLRLANSATVAQLLQRTDFAQRMRSEQPIGVHELFYPLLQGYDSVAIHADVELGGNDQLFNLLRGRDVQTAYGEPPQDIITVPLLEGLDGEKKMSKSLGNAVAVADKPSSQFGLLMSIPDPLITRYLTLLTDTSSEELTRIERDLHQGSLNPRDAKADLAEQLVSMLHDPPRARAAREEFFRVHRDHDLPSEIPEVTISLRNGWDVRDLLVATGLAKSKGEAARLIQGGAVELAGDRIADWREPVTVAPGTVLKVGARRVVRLVPG
ncbi:MAG TPA: tyrosine--tRNA ligase [Candidatus Dormibacteraeota bacterium]|nr:tyrosine--tRNA ligase [Candidatus Dormibacteraeota bacterium]